MVAANALGVLVAVVPGSSGEGGHLYAVVTVMAAIALSGLVAPAPYTQVFLPPFWYLYAALLAAPPEAFALAPPVLAALLLGSVLAISPPGLFRSR
ncbi:hypothetical protein [Methanoculleus chikugoensis]|uniref:hypothetical protein n=1 Tax=Methanoculleus chikugoensis TaxID=118126 RepID=UPI0006D183EE|nr:hypothetical protein [Methanoculleus chikugoensis]